MAAKAIVVGIGNYRQFGRNGAANDLPGAIEDAKAVANWLVNTASATVTLITSDGITKDGVSGPPWTLTEMRPVAPDVDGAFKPWIMNSGPKVADRLYVYMAGHGLAPEPTSRCLITADATGTSYVPNVEAPAWIKWFANQTHFDELVLWMDCCATQALEYTRGGPVGVRNTASRTPPPAKIFMAFASGYGRESYEGPIGPNGEMRGLFTDRLLRGLNGAATKNGQVRSASLANFLRNGTLDDSASDQQLAEVPLSDDMLFVGAAQPPIYRIGMALPDGTPVVLTSPPSPLSLTALASGGWVSFPLDVGLFKLVGGGMERLIEVGATTPLEIV